MVWTAPRSWTVGEVPSAPTLNLHLRDNLLASEVPAVTTAGDLPYGTGSHTVGRRAISTAGRELAIVAGVPNWRTAFPIWHRSWVAPITPAGGANLNTGWSAAPGDPDLGGGARQWYGADSAPSGALNDEASWYVLIANGTYTLWLAYVKYSSAGQVQPYIDDVAQGSAIDMYAAALAANQTTSITGIVVANPGRHTVKLKVTGKNASSSGYNARISRIALARTA
jgi:hypothetical protein